MDDSNHEMLGVLAQQMGTIFNPLIQSTTQTNLQNAQANQQMAAQIGRLADFFGAPREAVRQPPPQPTWVRENQGIIFQEEPTINQAQPLIHPEAEVQQPIRREEPPRPQQAIPREEPGRRVVLVNRN